MYHPLIKLVVVWAHLFAFTSVQGNTYNTNNGSLIFIDSKSFHHDDVEDNLNFRGSDIADEYYKCCDEYYENGSGYSSENKSEIGSGYSASGCICCATTLCLCASIQDTIHHTQNNTVIVMGSSVDLIVSMGLPLLYTQTTTTFEDFTNLSLIGYNNATVDCNFLSSLQFKNCNNVTIENITWINCGSNINHRPIIYDGPSYINRVSHYFFNDPYNYGLILNTCSNAYLKNCTFVASKVGSFAVSGNFHIDQVNFLSSAYNIDGDLTSIFTIINEADMISNDVTVSISNSIFSTMGKEGLLLFYIFADNPNYADTVFNIFIEDTNVTNLSSDPDSITESIMQIRLSSNVNVAFSRVKIASNHFTGKYTGHKTTTILSISADLSTSDTFGALSRVTFESCSFLNNTANNLLHIQQNMYLNIIDTSFLNNSINSALFITSYRSNEVLYVLLLQSSFVNNIGSYLVSLNSNHALVNVAELWIMNNTLSSEYNSLLLFHNYTTLYARFNKVIFEYNSINGRSSGFYFVPKRIIITNDNPFVFTRYYGICNIPPEYQFAEFGYYCLIIGDPVHQVLFANSSFNNNMGGGHGAAIYFNLNVTDHEYDNNIKTCIFSNNSGYTSLIYSSSYDSAVRLIVTDSVFMNNDETVVYISNQVLQFSNEKEPTIFDSTRAQNGAALYLELDSKVRFKNNSIVSFNRNTARRYGGAIYYDITQSSSACRNTTSVLVVEENASLDFINNVAGLAGNSVYFSVSQLCNHIIQYDDSLSYIFKQTVEEIITSPEHLRLYYPAYLANQTDFSTYHINDIMLGQNIIIPACVLDQHEMPAGPVQFMVQLLENNDLNYTIQGNTLISVNCDTLQGINNLQISGRPPTAKSTITIQVNSFYDSIVDWKPITVILNVQLSSCHSGFYYNGDLKHCVCYTTDDIVKCSDSNSSITTGYWFGSVNDQPTVTACPLSYCNFDDCQTVSGTCDLYPLRDNQCRSHRSGPACGNCEEGYTLSFDSNDCISVDNCTMGQTVLVIMMSLLFWVISIVVVFSVMYFKVDIGYLYGITFYYSTIDILFGEVSLLTENVHQFVIILSSAAKLIPQFLGQLCLVKGLSGIDQQFIHYLHPFAVLLLLSLISFSTKLSRRLSNFVSRAIIHAISLLFLLSYTSIASTSVLLMRSISFANIDEVYSYLSPGIEYFHGRHLIYVLIAAFTGLVVMIGLPLLLLLEPFINSKINFIRIKPFLDQFQGCYKDKFRYFASYYMIFRLIILTIVVINPTNNFITLYSLLVLCVLLTFIHIAVRPYASNVLNLFDSFMLFTMILVIPLLIVEAYRGFPSNTTFVIALLLTIAPLIAFLSMVIYLQFNNIKKFTTRCIHFVKPAKTLALPNSENVEMHQCEHEVVVDEELRDKSTTIV